MLKIHNFRFNPCFIGTYSFTTYSTCYNKIHYNVLILVLLELILLLKSSEKKQASYLSFNPCFIGTYSFTLYIYYGTMLFYYVLILVLLELILLHNNGIAYSDASGKF